MKLIGLSVNESTRKPRNYWDSKENVINESKKYINRTSFKENSQSAYNSARRHDWLSGMHWLDKGLNKHPKGYWKNKENMMNEAKKYSTKEEFKKGNLTAFLAAYRYGYIEEMDWLVKRKHHKWGHWNYDNIKEEAFKYDTKTDFYNGNQTAYRAALKLGIIDEFFFNDYVEY